MADSIVVQTSGTTYPGSGLLTFAQIKSDIATIAGVKDDPAMETLAGRFFNEAIDDLNRRQTYIFNLVTSPDITTVAGTADYAIPADFWRIYNARKTDGIDYQLSVMGQKTFDTLFTSQRNINGFMYMLVIKNTFRGGTVKFFPTPDGVYTVQLNYFKLIGRLSGDSDTLDLPRPYESIPGYGARGRMLATLGQLDQAKYWTDLYELGYQTLKRSDEDEAGEEELRFIQVEEILARSYSFVNPASRPRALDLF